MQNIHINAIPALVSIAFQNMSTATLASRANYPEQRDPRFAHWAELAPTDLPPGEWPAKRSVPLSVLVPAKNEQANLPACLQRLLWASQIVVVDSQSTDATVPIAQAMGAEVYQFYYSQSGWPKKKNWALDHVSWAHEWVLIMDADEHMTPELAQEIADVVAGRIHLGHGCGDGYFLNRRFMFMGRWIRHCGYYPSWNLRLFKHAVGRYERIGDLGQTGSGDNEVHEHVILATGEAAYLRNDFLHLAYPDLSTWVEKHNRYSTWEAHAMDAGNSGGVKPSLFAGPIARRRWLKTRTRRLPFRPFLRFLYSYFLQGGFLDGYPGYCMCRLLAWYEFISLAKLHEMQSRAVDTGLDRERLSAR
jgi:glycosyltransferase involved in cell wall biosynthesis